MQSEDLYKAIGKMDDRFIDDRPVADVAKPKRLPRWSKFVAAAACMALLVYIGASIWRQNQPSAIVYPSRNIKANYMEHNASWYETVYWSYAELAEKSDIIVVADVNDIVLEHAKGYDETVFISFAKISVYEAIKGSFISGDKLYVCDNGLSCINPTMTLTYSGGPLMEKGNRVLLFLQSNKESTMENGEQYYTFLSPFLGPFFYDEDGKYHEVLCYSDIGTERDLFPIKLTDYEPKTLEEIKRLVVK